MNARIRQRVIQWAGIAGGTVFSILLITLAGPQNILVSCLTGTLGYAAFTGMAILATSLVTRSLAARPADTVIPFGGITKDHEPLAGGKGRALAKMYQAGCRVPDGFVILPAAFSGDELRAEAWAQARRQLARLRRAESFAVRSSALCEDSAQASFAGEFETVLDVRTDDEIRAAIGAVRRSRHSARVQTYSAAQGLEQTDHEIAVVVQCMVRPEYSGVLFTVDPLTGDLARMTGNYVQGIGETLVSGQANPHIFTFERPKGVYQGPPALSRVARELFADARDLERTFGGPQDIEWAVASGKVYLLQSRPITTLRSCNPATGERNDTLSGSFLWSATNLSEACPEVMTPFTASLRYSLQLSGGPSLTVRDYPMMGIIAGRSYVNISVQISAFGPMFGGDSRRAYREVAGWWGDIPEDMEIPLVPLTTNEWFKDVMPGLLHMNGQLGGFRKRIPAFVADTPRKCAEACARIRQIDTPEGLAALWRDEIRLFYGDSIFYVVAAAADLQVRLERELRDLMGPEDANALLSNLGGLSSRLESFGPMIGLDKVSHGEMSREAYLEAYGHRGENECEIAWPRPAEDPAWLDRQLAGFAGTPVAIEARFSRQRAAYEAAWERFRARYPDKANSMQRRLVQVAQAARQREAVRSEATRVVGVVRAFALRAGEFTGLGDDMFFLTIDETLATLAGDLAARRFIAARKETHERYRALPPYPTIICGRFDAFAWAASPNRRSDIFDAHASAALGASPNGTVKGFPGALGVVEGTVRRLDRLEDSDQLRPGEILVTTLTNIGWTPLFPRAAAIVTDLGAPLSHAAIVARELGIPAVVGCGDATTRLQTGDRVRVDGGQGRVEIL